MVPARVPVSAKPVGGCGVAMLSQSKNVPAGRAGKVMLADPESGRLTSGRSAVRMTMLRSDESAGGQWHSIEEKEWKVSPATALQVASSESRLADRKSTRLNSSHVN